MCREKARFWAGVWMASELSRKGKGKHNQPEQRATRWNSRRGETTWTCLWGTVVREQRSSWIQRHHQNSEEFENTCLCSGPLTALRICTVHHRLIQSHWELSHPCQRRRQRRRGGIMVKDNAQATHSRINQQTRDGIFVWLWFMQTKAVSTLSEGNNEQRQAH